MSISLHQGGNPDPPDGNTSPINNLPDGAATASAASAISIAPATQHALQPHDSIEHYYSENENIVCAVDGSTCSGDSEESKLSWHGMQSNYPHYYHTAPVHYMDEKEGG